MTTHEIYVNYMNLTINTLSQLKGINFSNPKDVEKAHRLLGELRASIPRIRRTMIVMATEKNICK